MIEPPTPRFALPLLAGGQAQKEMSHNEALMLLDIVVQACALDADVSAPPADPEPGDCWILGDAPEGAWAGHAREIAAWTSSGWRFVAPREGIRMWIAAFAGFAVYSGGDWTLGRAYGRLIVDGEQVVGPRTAAIVEPMGGVTVDAEARTAVIAVLEALRTHGLIEAI